MSVFDFVYCYKSSNIRDIYRLCQKNISDLKLTNKKFSDKKEDLVEIFSKKSTTLLPK